MNTLAAYALTFILLNSPPHLHTDETPLGYVARAADISCDIADIVGIAPPIFKDDASRVKTISLLLSVAFFESNFQRYVDVGDCLSLTWRKTPFGRAMIRAHADCDKMAAGSLWQIHGGERGLPESWALAHDRRLAVATALKMMAPGEYRLRNYTGETTETGFAKAEARASFAERWVAAHPLGLDSER